MYEKSNSVAKQNVSIDISLNSKVTDNISYFILMKIRIVKSNKVLTIDIIKLNLNIGFNRLLSCFKNIMMDCLNPKEAILMKIDIIDNR